MELTAYHWNGLMIFWQTGNEFVLGTVIPVGVMWLVMFHRVVYFVYYVYKQFTRSGSK